MNNTSESILSAVDILVNEAISKLSYDKTIIAEITSIVNLDSGEYKIKYTGNIVSAFSSDLEKQYKVGDSVYVTIPEGELSNKKIILCRTDEQSLSYGEMLSLSNSIIEASPTFDTMYQYDKDSERGVVAGAPITSDLGYNIIYDGSENNYHGLFQQYSRQYNLIRIQASFLTAFHSEHSIGNYGLEVQFFTKGNEVVSYKLDLNSFNGDFYSLSVYSPQSIVIETQTNYLTGLKQIKLFQEGFEYDRYVEYGQVTDKQNTTVPNIFVKDIQIQFVEKKDLTDNLYYLDIATPQGNIFTSNITTIDLVGRLIYQGDNIISSSNCECYWYERDIDVTIGQENYDKKAGIGWKQIQNNNFNQLSLTSDQVIHEKQLKLVVIYNDTTLSAENLVYNINSPYNFKLQQDTVGEDILISIYNNIDNEDILVGDWYALYPDGNYVKVGSKQNSLTVTNLLLYSYVTFICGVYDDNHQNIISVLSHTISSSDSQEDISITYIGEDSFRYDANGDVTIEDAEKERTLQVTLTWKDEIGTSYRVEWIGPDGENITNFKYSPSQSMIENLWVDSNNILHYTIKQKYKSNYNNNTIIVKIITIDEKEYLFQKEILFLKDGDQGTNGTTYIAAIRPFDNSTGLKLSGFTPLIYRENNWQNSLPVRCYVYKDGELINENGNYTISYKWNGINLDLQNSISDDKKVVRGTSALISNPIGGYVKVQVTINDNKNDRSYDIYCNYPIDIAIDFSDEEINNIDISSIPSYIKYTASGINPQFYSNNIQFLLNGNDYSEYISSLTETMVTIEENEGLYYIEPVSSFIFEDNSIALLRCAYDNKYIYHPIILYLDTYGNELINGWDGTSLAIDEENGQYIFAPQIGAGKKDNFNRFTGVVMGQDNIQDKIGLYGYQSGVNTFGLMEDGTAFFGAKSGGGQIKIDGTSAEISGGDGGNSASGMTITLADLRASGSTDAIKIGNGVFKVQYNGTLTATNANVTGTITANSGYIGGTSGWTIAQYRLYSNKSGSTYIELNCNPDETCAIWCGSSSSATAISSKFAVTKTGLLYAKEGNIGGWNMKSTYLQASSGTVGMASSGNAAFWAGSNLNADSSSIPSNSSDAKFLVTRSGKLYCSSADISGKITATSGTIGGWTITSNRLQSSDGSVYLSTSGGLRVGNNFNVSSSGTLTVKNANIEGYITATSLTCDDGTIGGWTIGSNYLFAGSTYLYSTGVIRTDYVDIYQGGRTYLGTLGYVAGQDDNGVTNNIGIETTSGDRSIILQSARNIALRADGAGIWCTANQFHMNVPKEGQSGIYAQFA